LVADSGHLDQPIRPILITLLAWAEECLAGDMGGIWSSPLTVVSSHSSLAFVKPDIRYSCTSIATIAARRFDAGEGVEIKLGDRLQRLGGGAVAKSIRRSAKHDSEPPERLTTRPKTSN
jgi:hypothetical protein